MDFVKLRLMKNGYSYLYQAASTMEMDILGIFLSDDVGACDDNTLDYKEWSHDDSLGMGISGNFGFLEKEGEYIFLTEIFRQKGDPTELKMSRQQFAQLLDEWQEKVCKIKPKEVIITHENDMFMVEVSD